MKKEKDNIIGMLPNENNKKKKNETSVGINFVQALIYKIVLISFCRICFNTIYVNYQELNK